MNARYIQRGESIDFTPTSDIHAGDVVQIGRLVGIAKLDIKAGELGALALSGVYEMKLKDGETVDAGDGIYFDAVAGKATKTAPGAGSATTFSVGVAVGHAGSGELVNVRLSQTRF